MCSLQNKKLYRAPNNNKQPCSCQTSLRNLLFHLVQRISLHFKSTDLYLFCTTKVFPKFLLPFQSQASFQSEQFGSYDYAARSLSLVACSLTSQRSRMLMQKRPLLEYDRYFGYRENFPYFTACDWLHASELVNADCLIFIYRT